MEKLRAYAVLAPRARRNRFDLVRQLVRRPALAVGVGAYEAGLFVSVCVENRTKTLAAIKTSSLIGCPFCLDLASGMSRAFGIDETELRALSAYRQSSVFTEREKLAIELAEAMTQVPVRLDGSLRDRLAGEFTPAQLVELAAEVAWENHRARLYLALGVRPMGFSEGGFCISPETAAGLRSEASP